MKYEGMVGREELKNKGGEWDEEEGRMKGVKKKGREGVEKGLGKGEL